MRLPSRHWLWAGGAAMLLVAGLMATVIPARDWTSFLADALEERNRVSALLVFCAAYVVGTLLLLPSWIFPVAAGAAFGPLWGLLASVVSSSVAAMAAFLVARYVVRERVERAARKNETFVAVDKAMQREPWKVVALLRLSPILPSGAKSYFLGLTCVGPLAYALASAAGMLPGLALKSYVGHLGRGAFEAGGPLKWALLAGGVAATVAITVLVNRSVRRRLGL